MRSNLLGDDMWTVEVVVVKRVWYKSLCWLLPLHTCRKAEVGTAGPNLLRVFALQFFISWKEKVPKRKETGVGGTEWEVGRTKDGGRKRGPKEVPTYFLPSFFLIAVSSKSH